jgi:hypothetical protein
MLSSHFRRVKSCPVVWHWCREVSAVLWMHGTDIRSVKLAKIT